MRNHPDTACDAGYYVYEMRPVSFDGTLGHLLQRSRKPVDFGGSADGAFRGRQDD